MLLVLCSCEDNNENSTKNETKSSESSEIFTSKVTKNQLDTKMKKVMNIGSLGFGGYTTVPMEVQNGDLYSTYYTLKILNYTNNELKKNTNKSMYNMVKNYLDKVTRIETYMELYDFYYALEISREIEGNAYLNYSQSMKLLHEMYNNDGTFWHKENSSENELNKMISTITASKIIKSYGKDIPDKTKNWLNSEINSLKNYSKDNIDIALDIIQLFGKKNLKISPDVEDRIVGSIKGEEIKSTFDMIRKMKASKIFPKYNYHPSKELFEFLDKKYKSQGGWNAFFGENPEQLGTYQVLNFFDFYDTKYNEKYQEIGSYYKKLNGLNNLYTKPIAGELNVYLTYIFHDLFKHTSPEINKLKENLISIINNDTEYTDSNRDIYYLNMLVEKLNLGNKYKEKYIINNKEIKKMGVLEYNQLFFAAKGKELDEHKLKELYSYWLTNKKNLSFPISLYIFSILGIYDKVESNDVAFFVKAFDKELLQYKDEGFILYLLSHFITEKTNSTINDYFLQMRDNLSNNIAKSSEPIDITEYYYFQAAWKKFNNVSNK